MCGADTKHVVYIWNIQLRELFLDWGFGTQVLKLP